MAGVLETVKTEWHTIKAAPWSFLIICTAVLTASLAGFHWYYSGRLDDADRQTNQWKGTADYWKDRAERPQAQAPVNGADPKKADVKALRRPNVSKQSAPVSGNNNVVGNTVTGNQNVVGNNNQVTVGAAPPRKLSPDDAAVLAQIANVMPGNVNISTLSGDVEAWKLGTQIADALRSTKWNVGSPQRTFLSVGQPQYGIQVTWKGDKAQPGQNYPLDPKTPWGALTIALVQAHLTGIAVDPEPNGTEGQIWIMVYSNPAAHQQ